MKSNVNSNIKSTKFFNNMLLVLVLLFFTQSLFSSPVPDSFFKEAFSNIEAPMLVIDPENGAILKANSAALKFYGKKAAQLESMKVEDLNIMMPDEIRTEINAAKTGEKKYFIFRHKVSGGEVKSVAVTSHPVVSDGKLLLFSIINDITERTELEKELLRSYEIHNQAEQLAQLGHWELDLEKKEIKGSEGAKLLYGFDTTFNSLEKIKNTALPEYREILDNALTKLVLHNEPYDVTFKIKRRSDNAILTIRSVAHYNRETGKVFGILLNMTDFTERAEQLRKRTIIFFVILAVILVLQFFVIMAAYRSIKRRKKAEHELLLKTDELENFFDLTIDMLCIADTAGTFVKLNKAWENVLGYTVEELTGKNYTDFIHPDDIAKTDLSIQALERQQQIYNFENRYRTKSGEYRLLEWRSNPQGNLIYAAARDITEKNKADEELRKRENLLGKIFEILPVGLWIADKKGTLISGNPMGIKIWGTDQKEGISDYSVFKAKHLPSGEEVKPDDWALYHTITKGATIRDELLEIEAMDGCKRIILNHTSPVLDDAGNIDGAIIVNQDITEVKKMEEERIVFERQIQQTQKLESLGVLAGGIAHDFNNILMAVLGHAELALDELSSLSPARRSLKEIETAARRAADLCRQMLAYSGKASFFLERVDLLEMIEEMVHLLKTSISKKAILNLDLEKGLPPIMADPSQIRQIIMNLIINASDAIGQRSGVVTISLGAVKCDADYLSRTDLFKELTPGYYVYVEVADTGCGMERETLEHIFEPFFTTKFTGRGLGLAAVLGIVRAHKGAIKVYSEKNRGTTFKVLFPALESSSQNINYDVEKENASWKGSGTVLIADDEESLRALGSSMLEHLGFNVIAAADGREAVDLFSSYPEKIDLVILDLTMPHMDGSQAFSELMRIDPQVKVIIASGYNKDDVGARFAGKNLAGVLQKPYSMSKLKELLAAVFGNNG
ncbi:MAG: PAS domain S-box protein [Spirochaetia bacterium]|jgi:PAS domain S-box-containing protein|nr:PAS domain S-box protein [Spirochaetia bacterium]